MCLRATIGHAAFEAEKQGNPINPEACEWPSEYFDYPGFWFDDWPNNLDIKGLGLDPSKGKDAKLGDYSAYVRVGLSPDMILYVEADLKRRPTPVIVEDGVEHVRIFQPDVFMIETNQFQELLVAEFARCAAANKMHLPIMPIENTMKKEVRIRRLGTYLAQHRFRFKARSPGTLLLVQQAKDFPVGDHDDGIDSLEMAIRGMVSFQHGKLRDKKLPRGLRV